MPKLVEVKEHRDARGALAVIEKIIPFQVQRVFFIYDVQGVRGGHRHHLTKMALVALGGEVQIDCQTPKENLSFKLNKPTQVLFLDPEDWHEMTFSKNANLIVLASHVYDPKDYIYEKYR
jgi:hypothetical protein